MHALWRQAAWLYQRECGESTSGGSCGELTMPSTQNIARALYAYLAC